MTDYQAVERRLVLRLLAHWDGLRGERDYPSRDEIDPARIGGDWAHCFLLRTPPSPGVPALVQVGETLAGPLSDPLPIALPDVPGDCLLAAALGYLERALHKGVPMSLGGQSRITGEEMLHRSVLLPLAADGRTIDHVLGAINGRRLSAAERAAVDPAPSC